MADINLLAELIRRNAAGYGESDVDKINRIFGTIGTAGDTLTTQAKAYQDIQKGILEQQAAKEAIAKAQREGTVIDQGGDISTRGNMSYPNAEAFRQAVANKSLPKMNWTAESNQPIGRTRGEMVSDVNMQNTEADTYRKLNPITPFQKQGIIRYVDKITGNEIRREKASPGEGDSVILVGEGASSGDKDANKIPAGQIGLYTLSRESIGGVNNAIKALFPKGTVDSFDRSVAVTSNVPGSGIPVLGAVIPNTAPFSEKGQNVNRWLGNALAGRQLIQTGVAARPEETAALVRRFMANAVSDPNATAEALMELKSFYENYNNTLITRQPSEYTKTPILDSIIGSNSSQDKSPKPGGVRHTDANGNKAWVYPDGTYDEIR